MRINYPYYSNESIQLLTILKIAALNMYHMLRGRIKILNMPDRRL